MCFETIHHDYHLFDELRSLAKDWDGDGSLPPARYAIEKAVDVFTLSVSMGLVPRSVQATFDGGVVITFLKGNKHANIELCDNGEAVVLMEDLRDREELIFEVPEDVSAVEKVMKEYRFIWREAMTSEEQARELLKKGYCRLIIAEENCGFSARIIEFSGCFAEGDTLEEAAQNLERAAEAWLLAVIERGQKIPEDRSLNVFTTYSGT